MEMAGRSEMDFTPGVRCCRRDATDILSEIGLGRSCEQDMSAVISSTAGPVPAAA